MTPIRRPTASGGALFVLVGIVAAMISPLSPVYPAPTAAQTILPPSGQDVIGLYAPDPDDPDAPFTPERVYVAGGPGEYDVWIFLTTISFPTVAGYEFSLEFVDGAGNPVEDTLITAAEYAGSGTNAADWPDFVVELGGVLGGIPPYSVWLVRITVTVGSEEARYARLRPVPGGPSIPDALGYWDDFDPPRWRQMYPIAPDPRSGVDYDRNVFAFNDEGFVGASRATWSTVKALFR